MISSVLLRFLEPFSCSLAHPHILLDHFRGLYPGFLVFISYQIPSHLVYQDLPAYSQRLLVLLDQEYYFAD